MKYINLLIALLFYSSSSIAAMVYDANEAFCDSFGRVCGDGYAFKINNKKIRGNTGSTAFTFVDDFGFLTVENNNGKLMGRISNGLKMYDIYAEFNDLTTTPVTTPKKQLKGKAYSEKGPVDTNTWQYTGNTSTGGWTGYLLESGALDDGYQVGLDAATFEFSLIGAGFQLGNGANGKNVTLGVSAWLQFYRVADGKALGRGNINLDLSPAPVPLPDSLPLFLSATAGLMFIGRKKEKN